MIKVREPRYHDNTVLIATFRIGAGQDAKVEIERGAYKGCYKVTNEVICKSPIEYTKSRNGRLIRMRAVPVDKMERIEQEGA